MCRLYVWALGVVVFVCGERKWLAYVAKARPSVLRILFVCVCCMRSWSELFMWTWCSESRGGVLGTSNTRKSGHTLNLSLQHNPHKERIQAASPLPWLLAALNSPSLNTVTHTHEQIHSCWQVLTGKYGNRKATNTCFNDSAFAGVFFLCGLCSFCWWRLAVRGFRFGSRLRFLRRASGEYLQLTRVGGSDLLALWHGLLKNAP